MMTGQKIEEKLRNEFQPDYLLVEDESYRHHVPAGAESHFKVIIVTDRFAEQRLLARHRTIYSLLAEELDGPVHALALHTYTLEEWQRTEDKSLSSPDCRGAGRHT